MYCLFAVPKPLCITARCFPLTPYFGYFNAANAVDHIRQGVALCFIGNLPVKNTSDLPVACSFNHLSHCMRADIASISHNGSEDSADSVSYTHLRAHETKANLVCRLLLEK